LIRKDEYFGIEIVMETIIVHLWDTNEEEVASFLQDTYPCQKGPPWIDEIEGDACLYINIYYDLFIESDPKEIAELTSFFGREPSVHVSADISSRHLGDHDSDFARTLLKRYRGVANDEYTSHLWTLEEIDSGYLVQGHTFSDHLGWYEEMKIRRTRATGY
jgi:hypothetical protein